MIQLNKDIFKQTIQLCALKVPNKLISEVRKALGQETFSMINFKNIQNSDDPQLKLIYLQKYYVYEKFKDQCPQDLKNTIEKYSLELLNKDVEIGYDNFSYMEVMQKIIPAEIGVPTGFELVGTLAHFNLKEQQIKYQNVIGQVLIDKSPKIKTVVNKKEKLDNQFRTPELELMAGENSYEVKVQEGKLTFSLNFQKVYWNSRNQHERDRTLSIISAKDTVLDMFCGVGPFALRAAKLGCNVIANDLNPECYEYLVQNAKFNKLQDKMLCLCDDARKVVHNFLSKKYLEENKVDKKFHHFSQVYMNLPVDNIEFLDCLKGLLRMGDPSIWNKENLPTIHLYCFVKGSTEEECRQLITERIQKQLPNFQKNDITHFVNNKDINQNVRMYCLTFKLREEDALLDPIELDNSNNQNNDQAEDYEKIEKKVKV